ncbi:MAG: hypothetical protein AB1473_23510 [Thermodesulfobacteriota bacterium]
MAQRQIVMEVTNQKVGYSWLWNWKAGKNADGTFKDPNLYLVPTYQMNLWVKCPAEEKWRQVGAFEVVRFGINNGGPGGSGSVCGLKKGISDKPLKRIDAWYPEYEVHSGDAPDGGWIIHLDYLVHAGSENPTNVRGPYMGATG